MKRGPLTRRDLVILGLLLAAVLGVTGYRYWQSRQRSAAPLDLGGLPGIVALSSTGCPACTEQKRVFDELAPQYEGRAKFVRLDVYEYIELARQHNVQYVPTLLFIDQSGEVVQTKVGFTPADELTAWLESVGVTP